MRLDAISAVKDVASEAGDASGNADRADYMLLHKCDIDSVIEALEWAQQQSKQAAVKAAIALEKVKLLKAQGGAA